MLNTPGRSSRVYEAADAESSESWSALLVALKRRGLDPEAVRMVVSDGTSGLPAALKEHLPTSQQQRCFISLSSVLTPNTIAARWRKLDDTTASSATHSLSDT